MAIFTKSATTFTHNQMTGMHFEVFHIFWMTVPILNCNERYIYIYIYLPLIWSTIYTYLSKANLTRPAISWNRKKKLLALHLLLKLIIGKRKLCHCEYSFYSFILVHIIGNSGTDLHRHKNLFLSSMKRKSISSHTQTKWPQSSLFVK